MKRLQEQQNTLMYFSRILYNQDGWKDISDRALVFTIQVKNLVNNKNVKEAIYREIQKEFFGTPSSPDDLKMAMFIASDVEASRRKYIKDETLMEPLLPHYHGLILFDQSYWDKMSKHLSFIKGVIRSALSVIPEIKDDEIDEDGCLKSESIWIDLFQEKNVKRAKHFLPLADYIQYAMKAHLQSTSRDIILHEPSVFPFDIYATNSDALDANRIFHDLWRQQVSYNKSHKY